MVFSIVPMFELSAVAANFSTMSDMGKLPQTYYDCVTSPHLALHASL